MGWGESEIKDGGLSYLLWLAEDETELRLGVKRGRGVWTGRDPTESIDIVFSGFLKTL